MFAVDNDVAAIAALRRAPRRRARVEAVARDLFGHPLPAAELSRFDAVLFDPPRAGAAAQAREIAASDDAARRRDLLQRRDVSRATRASCSDGGYVCEGVTPIDQFRYSAHVEIFAAFRRAKAKRRRGVLG